jgi:hypothetical protein
MKGTAMAMNADREIHSSIYQFLKEEFDTIRGSLAAGEIGSFSDSVRLCRRIDGVLNTLEPHARSDFRARQLVRRGERLKTDLLASRPYLEKRIPADLVRQLFQAR